MELYEIGKLIGTGYKYINKDHQVMFFSVNTRQIKIVYTR